MTRINLHASEEGLGGESYSAFVAWANCHNGRKGGLHEAAEMWDYLLAFETESHCTTQAGLELTIFRLWSSKGWDFRKESQCVTEIQGLHGSYHIDEVWRNYMGEICRLCFQDWVYFLIHLLPIQLSARVLDYICLCLSEETWLH